MAVCPVHTLDLACVTRGTPGRDDPATAAACPVLTLDLARVTPGTPAQDTVAAVTRLSTVTPPGHLLILAPSSCVLKVFTQVTVVGRL